MRAIVLAVLLVCAASAAVAGSTTYRAGTRVLAIGDTTEKLVDSMGQPEKVENNTNEYGAKTGEFWYYRDGNKTVKFIIGGGKIQWIEEIR